MAIVLAGNLLYVTSLAMRRKKETRRAGVGFSILGYMVASASAYLGGHLVFDKKSGVDQPPAQITHPTS